MRLKSQKKIRYSVTSELITILESVKVKITDDSDLMWTSFETAKELRDELDITIDQLKNNDYRCLDKLQIYFAPACTFQEHALQNGWRDEYMKLADRFDQLYSKLKKGNEENKSANT